MITISSMRLLSVQDKTVCGAQEFVGNGSVFSANVNQLVMNLSVDAPKFDGFSVGSVNNGNVTVWIGSVLGICEWFCLWGLPGQCGF